MNEGYICRTFSFFFQKAKCEAAVERAILAEKNHLSTESKLKKVEKELEKLTQKVRGLQFPNCTELFQVR